MSQTHYQVRDDKALYEGRKLAEWVPEIVEAIVAASNPLQVILFGSVARGDDGPDSDIDLMVVLPSLDYTKRREWEAELGGVVSPRVPVQIFVTDERECYRRRDVIGSMHYWPIREGRVVYARAT
ncbi:MAG: nucleotidyltransferase domain-containing protein [Acidimicrobiales bacterium]